MALRILGFLATLVVAVTALGATAYVGLRTLASGQVLPAAVTLALVSALVFALSVAGSKPPNRLSTPYW